MKIELKIRAYQEGDEEGIFELWKAVYPERPRERDEWLRWWRWMYRDNPAGTGWIMLAEHNNKIVGHSAVIPAIMKFGAEIVTGFQSIDTMTDPAYRGQGIYQTLAKAVYDEAGKHGSHIGYRFPNEMSYPIAIKKLSWFDVAGRQQLIRIFKWENTLKTRISNKILLKVCALSGNVLAKLLFRGKKLPHINELTVTQVPHFDERINEFWTRTSGQYPIIVERSKNYLNWRYATVPNIKYSIYLAEKDRAVCGYLVLRYYQEDNKNLAVICDLLPESETIAQFLLHKAQEDCRKAGMGYLIWSGIANKAYLRAFRKTGFIHRPFTNELSRFCAYLSASDISKEFLLDPQNWTIQEGDTDSV